MPAFMFNSFSLGLERYNYYLYNGDRFGTLQRECEAVVTMYLSRFETCPRSLSLHTIYQHKVHA